MSSIYLYAELLLNIGQVTVFTILPSNSHQNTQIELLPDQRTLCVRHDDEQAVIQLPCNVLGNSSLKIPTVATRELSFRLQISGASNSAFQAKSAIYNECPWPASNFTANTQVGCQSCHSLLVDSVTVWKDLPSGGWADMMDFWHCHKPTVEHDNDSSAGITKGYSASNALEPGPGVGLVDISHLTFLNHNCSGISKSQKEDLELECSNCHAPVGLEDNKTGSFRLLKWSLAVRNTQDAHWETLSVQKVVSAQLMGFIEDHATRKFLAYNGVIEEAHDSLLLWVFTPDLIYSSIGVPQRRAMKLFYKIIIKPAEMPEHSGMKIDEQGTKVDELQLPTQALETLHADLKASTKLLPPPARRHQTWSIGLLDR